MKELLKAKSDFRKKGVVLIADKQKDGAGGSWKFAGEDNVIKIIQKPLIDCALEIISTMKDDSVVVTLWHVESGKSIESSIKLPPVTPRKDKNGNDMYLDAEIVEDEVVENIDVSKAIVVTQKPIIVFELLEPISKNVTAKIQSLNIESLEPTEDNLALIKRTRTDLKKDFDSLEDARKMAKELIMADYNRLDEMYKKLISSPFKVADDQLKNLVDTVESGILNLKIDGLKLYFNDKNTFDFVRFDDMSLKIIKSISDKKLVMEIDEYLANIKMSIATIETLPNKERVLAKFQMSKDLNRSISETNIEIQREEQIKAQNAERERQAEERRLMLEESKRIEDVRFQEVSDARKEAIVIQEESGLISKEDATRLTNYEQVYKASFTVYATKAQLSELKTFMKEKGVKYE